MWKCIFCSFGVFYYCCTFVLIAGAQWWPFCFWRPFYFLNCVMSRRSIWTTMQNLKLLAWKLSELWPALLFGSHFVFGGHLKKILQMVNMNFHAKSGAPSLKIDRVMINFVFWRPFCFLAAILFFFGSNFTIQLLRKVNMKYHAKSGAHSLKIEWVRADSPALS